MNIKPVMTNYYEQKTPFSQSENKANSKPNKPNLRKAKMNVSPVITMYYEQKTHLRPLAKQIQFQTKSNPIKPNFKGKKEYENISLAKGKKF